MPTAISAKALLATQIFAAESKALVFPIQETLAYIETSAGEVGKPDSTQRTRRYSWWRMRCDGWVAMVKLAKYVVPTEILLR